jgi:hypothetical protein
MMSPQQGEEDGGGGGGGGGGDASDARMVAPTTLNKLYPSPSRHLSSGFGVAPAATAAPPSP